MLVLKDKMSKCWFLQGLICENFGFQVEIVQSYSQK